MNADEGYIRLGTLLQSIPDNKLGNKPTQEFCIWLARIYAIIDEFGSIPDKVDAKKLVDSIMISYHMFGIENLMPIIFRVQAVLELKTTKSVTGIFIAAGNPLDAMAAISKIVNSAKSVVYIIDPYMDEKALTDFAILVPDGIQINLLADKASAKPTLSPALTRFKSQFTTAKPIEVRMTLPRLLHDRLIVIDNKEVWLLTQSLNALAARSPASIVQMQGDAVPLKLQAYHDYWTNAAIVT